MSTYQKLPIVFKQNWLAALRSGQIKQASGVLRALDKKGKRCQCCLGVACDVLNLEWENLDEEDNYYFIKGTSIEDLPTEDVFPRDIWNVLNQIISEENHMKILNYLALKNDGTSGAPAETFEAIASWIDDNL